MTKLTRKQKRDIREKVRAILIRKLRQINLAGFTESAGESETEYAKQVLAETITCMQPPGLVRIQAILREQGVPEHHIEERAQILWERSEGTAP